MSMNYHKSKTIFSIINPIPSFTKQSPKRLHYLECIFRIRFKRRYNRFSTYYTIVSNAKPLIAIIKPSSIMVTVLMGRLNTAPRQAHFIFRLFSTLCSTPIILMVISRNVKALVNKGVNRNR